MASSVISTTARLVLACLVLGAGAGSAAAQTPVAPAPALTAADATAYLDGFMPYALQHGDVAGAVVVVVKDGQILLEKGYGVADVATQAPVDPKTTLFRPGSTSKLFTWTAVMQLVEQGKLNLDQDVNSYLDFKIPSTWPAPITLRHLMTHTAGFEETIKHLIADDPKRLLTLEGLVKAWVPTRIYPPGQVSAYSNYGAALAGYIVQRASGQPFDEYVAQHVMRPLGMTLSTFKQPLPEALTPQMSKGYLVASGPVVPFELISPAPAGSLSSTGEEMAYFMMAQLNDGAYGDARILQRDTAELMHRTTYTPVAPLPGMALGFYHEDRNGHVIIGHAGDTDAFHSDLHLILDANVGIFISMNSAGKDGAAHTIRRALFHDFMDRYYPVAAAAPAPTLPSAAQDAERLAGTYESSRKSDSNFIRLASVIGGPTTVTANDDGTVTVSAFEDDAGEPKRWREVAPFQWQDIHSASRLVAIVQDGQIEKFATDDIPPVFVFSPVHTLAAAGWNRPLLFATLGVLLLIVLAWPAAAILRWRYDRRFALQGRAATLYRLGRGVALVDLCFLAGWCGIIAYGLNDLTAFDSPLDPLLRLLQAIGIVGVIGTVVPLYAAFQTFKERARPWWAKLASLVVALACLATVWFAFSQHLLTLGLDY